MSEIFKFFNDTEIWFKSNPTIKKDKLVKDLPDGIKTGANLTYIKENWGDNVSELEFVNLLRNFTHGGNWISFDYLIKYFDLSIDSNNMIIFTKDFPYRSVRKEALFIWWQVNLLRNHPIYKNYMDNQLVFHLQQRLEIGIFPTNENFKYDACFSKRDLGFECNEGHHETTKQKVIDARKKALAKFHGILLMSLRTNSVVNINHIKSAIHKNFERDLNDCRSNILNMIIDEFSDIAITPEIKDLIEYKLIAEIKTKLKKKYTKKTYKQLAEYSDQFSTEMDNNITNVCKSKMYILDNLVNDLISKTIKDSQYLKEYMYEFFDKMLCSLLKDFDFRQDYIVVIFKESLVDILKKNVNYIKYIKENKSLYSQDNYSKALSEKTNEFIEIKMVLEKFISNSDDFLKLFNIKTQSLNDPNIPNIITFEIIIDLLGIFDVNDINEFRILLNYICNLDLNLSNDDIRQSWIDLNMIFRKYSNNTLLTIMLILYYTMLDTMYENIIRRNSYHDASIICKSSDYYTYMSRVQKKNAESIEARDEKILDQLRNNKQITTKVLGITAAIISNSSAKSLPEYEVSDIPLIKTYNSNDLEMISRTNIEYRVKQICDEFDELIIDNDMPVLINENDCHSEESDVD